jgi:hypothetical protein
MRTGKRTRSPPPISEYFGAARFGAAASDAHLGSHIRSRLLIFAAARAALTDGKARHCLIEICQ